MKAAYFPHDYNARTDPKLQEVIMTHGMAGIGVYWCIVEMMYEQGGELPLRNIKSIAFNLHADLAMVESIVNDFDLFVVTEDKFSSKSLKARLNNMAEKSAKASASINARWAKERAKKEAEQNTEVLRTQYECNTNVQENDTNVIRTQYECNTNKINKNKIKEKDKKEKASSSSSLPIHEEIEDVKGDNTWIDYICMNHHIIPANLLTMLNEFKAECIANGIEKHIDIADVKSHINSWLRIQVNNKNKKKNKENGNSTSSRRGYDVSDTAEYTAGGF